MHGLLCELWKLSDELFAQVPLPYNVLIDLPELDDALAATHSAVESAKVCYASPRLNGSAHAGSLESSFGCPTRRNRRSLLRKSILYLSMQKRAQIEQECVEGLVRVPEENVLSSQRASSTFFAS